MKSSNMKSMNFVYISRCIKHIIVIGKIKYIWDDIDIRDYLSENSIKNAEDILIAKDGGIVSILNKYGKDSLKRKYQVIDRFTNDSEIKSKYLLICLSKMKWDLSEMMSEGIFEEGENYIEIVDENVGDMQVLGLASNLSYMYGIRFIPHTVKSNYKYRITSEEFIPEMWKDISDNVNFIKKYYKLENIYVDSAKKQSRINSNEVSEKDFEW